MALDKTEGYLFLCLGKSYIDDCVDLYDTLRKHNDLRPLDVVVLPCDVQYACQKSIFNNVISYDVYSDAKFNECNTSFEQFCLLPRLRFNKFLNYHYTLILDVDVLCAFSTEKVWALLKEQTQGLTMIGSENNAEWHWGFWGEICSRLNLKKYETHGGMFFFNKDYEEDFDIILKYAEECFNKFDNFGMKQLYQGGKVDEPCFAYSFNKMGYKPLNFADHSIMTFNLTAADDIPTKKMTEHKQYQACMKDFIPFIHMFGKNSSAEFKALKRKILNS